MMQIKGNYCLMRKEAFSIAEAFIMLIITSIAIGLSAPMITK